MAAERHRHQAHWDLETWTWLQAESARRKASVAQILRDLVIEKMAKGKPFRLGKDDVKVEFFPAKVEA